MNSETVFHVNVHCVITLCNLKTDCIENIKTTKKMLCAHGQSSSLLLFHHTALIHTNNSHTSSFLCFNFTGYSASNQNTQRQFFNFTLTRMKELEFDCSGGKYYSPEDGYSLTVPRGAIPENLGSVSIQHGVIPYGPFGPFKYPDGVKPVSPIVWFCSTSSVEFQKLVEITIPHCYDCDSEQDSQSLAFFKANHNISDNGPKMFHFKEVEGISSFPLNTSCGTLYSKHLCFYCIGTNDEGITSKAKFCLITAKPVCFQRRSRIHFCLTYLLETCVKVSIPSK